MLIASLATQGLWASEDGGASWSPLGKGPGSAAIANRGSTVVYDPEHPGTIWESGIYSNGGVYRTDDNGVTFRQLGGVTHSEAVSVDFSDPARRTILTAQHESSTVHRSSDGGNTWTDISSSLPSGIGQASGLYVIDGQTHLLGTKKASGSGVFRTTDGARTWTKVYSGGVLGQPLISKLDGAMSWVLESGGIIRSTDRGTTWTQVTRDGTISSVAPNLVELPDGRLAAVGNQIVIVSADRGATWRSVGPGIGYVAMGFAYSPYRNAFYIWDVACASPTNDPIPTDAIMSLSFNYKTD
jgi:photosystem II stability/assembly factor-like uncharacterized protein